MSAGPTNGASGKFGTPPSCNHCSTGRSIGRMCLKVWSAGVLVLLIGAIGLTLFARPRIHSCEIYIPNKLSALNNAVQAISAYGRREGWSSLAADLWSIVRAEVLNLAPYPELIDRLQNKHLLMIGGARTPTALKRARQLGVSLTVVDDARMASYMEGKVRKFIPIHDFGKISVKNPQMILDTIRGQCQSQFASETLDRKSEFDGIFTLVEDHGPLTSFLAEHLDLTASPLKSAQLARNKFLMREAMKKAGVRVPRYALIESAASLAEAATIVGFPAFLKPVYGVQATFASRVDSLAELNATFHRFQGSIDATLHPIYHHGKQMILESLLGGPEIQLELMLHDGRIIFHSFSSEYSAARDTLAFPMSLGGARRAGLLAAANRTVAALGLSHGVAHLELFDDPAAGPIVIEVNNRLSRGFLPQSFLHQALFGETAVDYYGSVYALAAGQAPAVAPWRRPHPAPPAAAPPAAGAPALPAPSATSASPPGEVAVGGLGGEVGALPPVPMAVVLDRPSTEWWAADPKDAPNRGWEYEGRCALHFAPSIEEALAAGRRARDAAAASAAGGEGEGGGGGQVVDCEWAVAGVVAWGAAVLSMRVLML